MHIPLVGMRNIVVIFALLLFVVVVAAHAFQNEDNRWIEPSNDACMQQNQQNSQERVAYLYFKKFIAKLFDRKLLRHDAKRNHFEREIVFTISNAQLQQLEELTDARDWDMVLTDIFKNARTSFVRSSVTNEATVLIWDILKDLRLLVKISEVQFLLCVAVVTMLGYYVHRRYHIGIIKLIVSSMLIYGYFHTYIECNRELDVEHTMEALQKQAQQNQKPVTSGWFSSWFSNSKADEDLKITREKLKLLNKIKLPFCRPDHVVQLYLNNLFLKQLEFLLDKCISTLQTLRQTLPFPFNYLSAGLLFILIGYIIKLLFKYVISPRAWWGFWHAGSHKEQRQFTAINGAANSTIEGNGDRLSGDNLKLLLKALRAPKVIVANNTLPIAAAEQQTVVPATPAYSGVQEILEQLEDVTDAADLSDSSAEEIEMYEECSLNKEKHENAKANDSNASASSNNTTSTESNKENQSKNMAETNETQEIEEPVIAIESSFTKKLKFFLWSK